MELAFQRSRDRNLVSRNTAMLGARHPGRDPFAVRLPAARIVLVSTVGDNA